MGYTSRLTGEITIEPPLAWSRIKDSRFNPSSNADRSVVYRVEEIVTADEDGERIIRRAVAIEDAWGGDDVKHYGIEEDLEEIASLYPEVIFNGWLILEGEEQGDIQRFLIRDGRVTAEKAVLMWPDGTTEST